jgi:hypothetical protein
MGERKVLNFYIPPDFDTTKLPRAKRAKQCEIRMMMPFGGQCTTCGEFIPRGKKFNSKLETIEGQEYLGLRIYRFIGKCPQCNSHFSFKTDPKSLNFAPEYGISRNFENWRMSEEEAVADKVAKEAEEKVDAIKGLESRTLESKRQMDMLDALEELRGRRAKQAHLLADPDALLAAVIDMRDGEEGDGGPEGADGDDGRSVGGFSSGGSVYGGGGSTGRSSAGGGGSGGEDGPLTAEDEALIARVFATKRKVGSLFAASAAAAALEGDRDEDGDRSASGSAASSASASGAAGPRGGKSTLHAGPMKPRLYNLHGDEDEDEDEEEGRQQSSGGRHVGKSLRRADAVLSAAGGGAGAAASTADGTRGIGASADVSRAVDGADTASLNGDRNAPATASAPAGHGPRAAVSLSEGADNAAAGSNGIARAGAAAGSSLLDAAASGRQSHAGAAGLKAAVLAPRLARPKPSAAAAQAAPASTLGVRPRPAGAAADAAGAEQPSSLAVPAAGAAQHANAGVDASDAAAGGPAGKRRRIGDGDAAAPGAGIPSAAASAGLQAAAEPAPQPGARPPQADAGLPGVAAAAGTRGTVAVSAASNGGGGGGGLGLVGYDTSSEEA